MISVILVVIGVLLFLSIAPAVVAVMKFFIWLAYDRHGSYRILHSKWYDGIVYSMAVPVMMVTAASLFYFGMNLISTGVTK